MQQQVFIPHPRNDITLKIKADYGIPRSKVVVFFPQKKKRRKTKWEGPRSGGKIPKVPKYIAKKRNGILQSKVVPFSQKKWLKKDHTEQSNTIP